MLPKFQFIVKNDPVNNLKIFRLVLRGKIIAIGNLNALPIMDDKDLGIFLTEMLNIALGKIGEKDNDAAI